MINRKEAVAGILNRVKYKEKHRAIMGGNVYNCSVFWYNILCVCMHTKIMIWGQDMGLFDKNNSPVFVKEDSEAETQLKVLKEIKDSAGAGNDAIDKEIARVEAGIVGEKQVHYELANSHMLMYVMHDLFLEHDGLTAQIDYLVITRYNIYVIECKNLYGNIEINNSGDFIRTMQYNGKFYKEGIYSPITQNRRHLELIKALRADTKNIITKVIFEKNFEDTYHSIVVLANPKTVLNDKYAKKEIKSQVIRADRLVAFIKDMDSKKDPVFSEKDMKEWTQFFLDNCKKNPVDYTQKYRELIESSGSSENITEMSSNNNVVCPLCGAPMVLRTARNGMNAGNQFYGCSTYPKCRGIVNIDS